MFYLIRKTCITLFGTMCNTFELYCLLYKRDTSLLHLLHILLMPIHGPFSSTCLQCTSSLNYTAHADWLKCSVATSGPISVGHGEIFFDLLSLGDAAAAVSVLLTEKPVQRAAKIMRPFLLGEWQQQQFFWFHKNVTFVCVLMVGVFDSVSATVVSLNNVS